MKILHDFIKSVLSDEIEINCFSKDKKNLLKMIGARRKMFSGYTWILKYKKNDEQELGYKLEKLRDFGFFFAGAAGGWPPAAVFDYLREKGFVKGKIIEIMWRSPHKEIKYER